jgi:hypothetical protein
LFKFNPIFSLFLQYIYFIIIGFYILALPYELIFIPQYTDFLKPYEGAMCITISVISFAYSGIIWWKLKKEIWRKIENVEKK